jgi:hypothetical protein
MKIRLTLAFLILLMFNSAGFAQVEETKPKDEAFCRIIYQFISESRISYRNIIKEPITVEGNWFYGASKIQVPGALKTVIKQNLYYHAYSEMLYTDSLPEAEHKYRELVYKVSACMPPKWKSYEELKPTTGYFKQYSSSVSNSSPSVYVEIVKKEGSEKLYTVQVRFLALN